MTALAAFAILNACAGQNPGVANATPAEIAPQVDNLSGEQGFSIEFRSEPQPIAAGIPAKLIFVVKDERGQPASLKIVHEKPMHLIAVSTDLAEFYHIHPEPQTDGSYAVTHTFTSGGGYRLYADFTPIGAEQIVKQLDVNVEGTPRSKVGLSADSKFEKTVDGLWVSMKPSKALRAGEDLTLDFQMFDSATGKPVTDLQNYLGELAHFVLISEDLKDFLHAHPMDKDESMEGMEMNRKPDGEGAPHAADDESSAATGSRSEVSAHTSFPRPGLYKVWAQFQRADRVISVPFVLRVGEAPAGDAAKSSPPTPAKAITILVSSAGYSPSTVNVKKGESVKLAFLRKDGNNCGGEVVFPKLDIKRSLPVGKTVMVEFKPREDGELTFSCGMNMLRGKVVVN